MRRIFIIAASFVLALGLAAPVLAANPERTDGPVLMAFNGDITVPAGDQADLVMVTRGDATISGTVKTVIVLDGTTTLTGATVDSVFATGGTLAIDAASKVTGDVRTLNTTVTVDPAASIGGSVSSLDKDLVAAASVLAPMALLFILGFVLVTIVAGLALAALAARQVRAAEAVISREPGQTLLVGIASLILIPAIAILAMMTIIGLPLGLAILLMVWPAAAMIGWLIAGIWIGEWLLYRGDRPRPERPYLAAVIGLLILQIVTIVPVVGPFIGAIASLFGFGAILLLAWRVFRQPTVTPTLTPPSPQPISA